MARLAARTIVRVQLQKYFRPDVATDADGRGASAHVPQSRRKIAGDGGTTTAYVPQD